MPSNPFHLSAIPATIKWLLIANGIGFVLQIQAQTWSLFHLALWPLGDFPVRDMIGASVGFQPWQLITYAFLHGSFFHLFFNMFALWMFGRVLEQVWGPRRFLAFYTICVVGAGLTQLVVATYFSGGKIAPTLGASGGVFGILLAFGMMFPNVRIMLMIPPIPMPAKYFVIGYGALELFLGVTNTAEGVAHFAHLGGMLFGLVPLLYWRSRGRLRQ